jgi:DNA-binding transcriptional regulator YiaG
MTGAELKRIRERLGMSQSEFADALGVQRNSVSRMELRREVSRMTEFAVKYLVLTMSKKTKKER